MGGVWCHGASWALVERGHPTTQWRNGYLANGQGWHYGCLTSAYNAALSCSAGSGDGVGM